MQHAVLALEMGSQSLLMGGNLFLDSFSIRVMDPVKPFFGFFSDFSIFIAQHGLPTRREVNDIGRNIPVPKAIVGATSCQSVALFAFLQSFPSLFVRQLDAYPLHLNWKFYRPR